MREILFRGKTDDGKWVEGYFVPDCLESLKNRQVEWGFIRKYWIGEDKFTKHEVVEVERNTVGQFTGLTDKNGKKIFEGDIVTGRVLHSLPINAVVAFRNGSFGLLWDRAGAETFDAFPCLCNIEYEVVGNVHDNPELLED